MASGSYARKKTLPRSAYETQTLIPPRASAAQDIKTDTCEFTHTYDQVDETLTFSRECTSPAPSAPQRSLAKRPTRPPTRNAAKNPAKNPDTTTSLHVVKPSTVTPVEMISHPDSNNRNNTVRLAPPTAQLPQPKTTAQLPQPRTTVRLASLPPLQKLPPPTITRAVDIDRAVRRDTPTRRPSTRRKKSTLPWNKPWFVGAVLMAVALLMFFVSSLAQSGSQLVTVSTDGQSFGIKIGGIQIGQPSQSVTRQITHMSGSYSLYDKPSISADFINQVLDAYHSPAAGKGQALYDDGVQYGVDPAFALAFFMHESSFGTQGMARTTLALGNERCLTDRPCVNTQGDPCQVGQSCYAKFYSWEDGFEHWYQLIDGPVYKGSDLTTVETIIPRYAPSADDNDEQAYIASVEHEIDTWHAGQIIVS